MFHTFWPLTTHSSPSRTALVPRPAKSLPAPGSLNSWHQRLLAGEHRAQEPGALLVVAVGDDGGAGEGHEEQHRIGAAAPAARSSLLDRPLQIGPHPEAAEARRSGPRPDRRRTGDPGTPPPTRPGDRGWPGERPSASSTSLVWASVETAVSVMSTLSRTGPHPANPCRQGLAGVRPDGPARSGRPPTPPDHPGPTSGSRRPDRPVEPRGRRPRRLVPVRANSGPMPRAASRSSGDSLTPRSTRVSATCRAGFRSTWATAPLLSDDRDIRHLRP